MKKTKESEKTEKSTYLCGEKDDQTEVIPKSFEDFLKKYVLYVIFGLLIILLLFKVQILPGPF